LIRKSYQYLASLVYNMSTLLRVGNVTRDKVWSIINYIFSMRLEIVKGTFIDIFVISSFYAILKLIKKDDEEITFQTLIKK